MTVFWWLVTYGAWGIVGALVLGLSLIATTPQRLGPLGVTVWFVILYLWAATVAILALYGIKRYFRLHASGAPRLRYARRQGLLVAGWMVGCLSMSSLGQLGWLDAILLGILLVIVEVYVRFRWP